MWSAEHSISSGDSPRKSGRVYGNFSGRSEPLGWSPLEPPAIIPPMKLATADFTRVSMVLLRRGSRQCDCVNATPPHTHPLFQSPWQIPARRRRFAAWKKAKHSGSAESHLAQRSLCEHGNKSWTGSLSHTHRARLSCTAVMWQTGCCWWIWSLVAYLSEPLTVDSAGGQRCVIPMWRLSPEQGATQGFVAWEKGGDPNTYIYI